MLTFNLDVSSVLEFSSSSGIKPLPGMLSFVCVCLSACQVNVFFVEEFMANEIGIAVIVLAVFISVITIVRSKLRGQKCIGCPNSSSCSHCNEKNTKIQKWW